MVVNAVAENVFGTLGEFGFPNALLHFVVLTIVMPLCHRYYRLERAVNSTDIQKPSHQVNYRVIRISSVRSVSAVHCFR